MLFEISNFIIFRLLLGCHLMGTFKIPTKNQHKWQVYIFNNAVNVNMYGICNISIQFIWFYDLRWIWLVYRNPIWVVVFFFFGNRPMLNKKEEVKTSIFISKCLRSLYLPVYFTHNELFPCNTDDQHKSS